MGTISKSNCLIFVIAAVLVTLFYGIKEQKLKYVVFSIILMGALMAPKCVNLYYAKKANVTISKGVPVIPAVQITVSESIVVPSARVITPSS